MLASFRGGPGVACSADNESRNLIGGCTGEGDDGDTMATVDVITSLLMQGAAKNAQTDTTGNCDKCVLLVLP